MKKTFLLLVLAAPLMARAQDELPPVPAPGTVPVAPAPAPDAPAPDAPTPDAPA
ncbi:spermidine/putrescine ABC transporter substrate-binding protein PotF, partial [bacterium]